MKLNRMLYVRITDREKGQVVRLARSQDMPASLLIRQLIKRAVAQAAVTKGL